MTSPLLELNRLSVSYGGAPVVDSVELSVQPGEIVALLGANGAGKSTLLKAIMGLVPATTGNILLGGASLNGLSPEARAARGLGYCPEGRRVFPGLTVRENLEVAATTTPVERRRRVADVHRLFPQLAAQGDRSAWQLSGGQQQMLAVGRALMTAPDLLVLDEPSLGLSGGLIDDLMARLGEIAAAGTAVLLGEQNAAAALTAAQRAYVLRTGAVARSGPAAAFADDESLWAVLAGV